MNIDSLREQFDELGVDPSTEVLEKCIEICYAYNVDDPVEFVEKWMAFSISNLNGADPTVQFLTEMENREFNKNQHHNQSRNLKRLAIEKSSNLRVYKQGNDVNEEVDDADNALLGSYICITPKNDKKAVSRIQQNNTPEVIKATTFTPMTYSPSITTSAKKSRLENKKAGNVVYSFGNYKAALETFQNHHLHQKILITLNNSFSAWIDEKTKYMTTSMIEDGQLMTERIFKIGEEITRKISPDVALTHCDELSQENVYCLGKIFYGGRGRKLDQKSALFIGFDENKLRTVQLDLSRFKTSASIFPGEICVIGGNNPRGKVFTVSELFNERLLSHSQLPTHLNEPMTFVIASAPFTNDENLLFDPLEALIENCLNNKPNVLILTGAFLKSTSKLIFDLATEVDEHFRSMLTNISEKLGENTKIIVVASVDDINSSSCYPTRPYMFKNNNLPPNIFLAPDPCILNINGIHIAITSVDITQHLADSEFCINAGSDKIRRYMNFLFHQKSFYPLFPTKIPTDIRLLHKHATISDVPHIFIAPSDLKFYMRDFNNCLCINPGRLSIPSDSESTGTFARLIVQKPNQDAKNTNSWISGQIICL